MAMPLVFRLTASLRWPSVKCWHLFSSDVHLPIRSSFSRTTWPIFTKFRSVSLSGEWDLNFVNLTHPSHLVWYYCGWVYYGPAWKWVKTNSNHNVRLSVPPYCNVFLDGYITPLKTVSFFFITNNPQDSYLIIIPDSFLGDYFNQYTCTFQFTYAW